MKGGGNWLYKRGFLPRKNKVFAGILYSPLFDSPIPPPFKEVNSLNLPNFLHSQLRRDLERGKAPL